MTDFKISGLITKHNNAQAK